MPIARPGGLLTPVRRVAPSFTGAFDSYKTGLEVAIGIRRMIGSYSGPLIRVQRASDNAQQDIGYTGTGDLDTTALMAFAGSSTLYVKTFYDQSGNANHVTNGGTITCARIVESGVLNTKNTKAAVKFYRDGTSFTFATPRTSRPGPSSARQTTMEHLPIELCSGSVAGSFTAETMVSFV